MSAYGVRSGLWQQAIEVVGAAMLCVVLVHASATCVRAQEADTSSDVAHGDVAVDEESWGDEGTDEVGFAPAKPPSETLAAHDDGWSEGDDAQGFEQSPSPSAGETASVNPGKLSATGFARHRTALWTEQLGTNALAQARTSLDGQARYRKRFMLAGAPLTLRLVAGGHGEVDLAYFYDQQRFDSATINLYRSRWIGGETYASLAQGPFELTIGRQIIPFGQGTMLSTLDVVNPRDLREPGLVDLEDMRIAVLTSRAGVFVGYHRLELMVVHEAYFGLRPPPMSFFSPIKPVLEQLPAPLIPHQYSNSPKRFSLNGQQYYARYSYAGPGADIALYGASTLDQVGLPTLSSIAQLAAMSANGQTPTLGLMHRRYLMLGTSAAVPVGALVMRGEFGIDLNRPIGLVEAGGSFDPTRPLFNYAFREQLNWMAGVTYTGIDDGSLSIEYAGRHVFHQPDGLLRPSLADLGILYRQNLFDERIRLTLATGTFGLFYHYQGLFGRLEVDYAFDNGVRTGLGYATYQPHSKDQFAALSGFNRNDRAYVSLRWDFMLD